MSFHWSFTISPYRIPVKIAKATMAYRWGVADSLHASSRQCTSSWVRNLSRALDSFGLEILSIGFSSSRPHFFIATDKTFENAAKYLFTVEELRTAF